MIDPIIQDVREARAAVAARFGFDLDQFFDWAKQHAADEKLAKTQLPITHNLALASEAKTAPAKKSRKRVSRSAQIV